MQKKQKGQVLDNAINRIIALICLVFLIVLSVLSLIVFGTIDFNTYAEKHLLIFRLPVKTILYVLALIMLLILLGVKVQILPAVFRCAYSFMRHWLIIN